MRCHEKIPGSFWHSAKIFENSFRTKSGVIQTIALGAALQMLKIQRRLDLKGGVKTFYSVFTHSQKVGTLAA